MGGKSKRGGGGAATAPQPAQAQGLGVAFVTSESNLILDTNGNVWQMYTPNEACSRTWRNLSALVPVYSPPIPVSEIQHWEGRWLISNSNELWVLQVDTENNVPVCSEWTNEGPVPGSPTPTSGATWGEIKARTGGK